MYQATVLIGDDNRDFSESRQDAQNELYRDYFMDAYPFLVHAVIDRLEQTKDPLIEALKVPTNQLVISRIEYNEDKYQFFVKLIQEDGGEITPTNSLEFAIQDEAIQPAHCYMRAETILQEEIKDWLSKNNPELAKAVDEGSYDYDFTKPIYLPKEKKYRVQLYFIKRDGTNQTHTIELLFSKRNINRDFNVISNNELIEILDYCNLSSLLSINPRGVSLKSNEHILRAVFHRSIEARLDDKFVHPLPKPARGIFWGTIYTIAHPLEVASYPVHQVGKAKCKKIVENFFRECHQAMIESQTISVVKLLQVFEKYQRLIKNKLHFDKAFNELENLLHIGRALLLSHSHLPHLDYLQEVLIVYRRDAGSDDPDRKAVENLQKKLDDVCAGTMNLLDLIKYFDCQHLENDHGFESAVLRGAVENTRQCIECLYRSVFSHLFINKKITKSVDSGVEIPPSDVLPETTINGGMWARVSRMFTRKKKDIFSLDDLVEVDLPDDLQPKEIFIDSLFISALTRAGMSDRKDYFLLHGNAASSGQSALLNWGHLVDNCKRYLHKFMTPVEGLSSRLFDAYEVLITNGIPVKDESMLILEKDVIWNAILSANSVDEFNRFIILFPSFNTTEYIDKFVHQYIAGSELEKKDIKKFNELRLLKDDDEVLGIKDSKWGRVKNQYEENLQKSSVLAAKHAISKALQEKKYETLIALVNQSDLNAEVLGVAGSKYSDVQESCAAQFKSAVIGNIRAKVFSEQEPKVFLRSGFDRTTFLSNVIKNCFDPYSYWVLMNDHTTFTEEIVSAIQEVILKETEDLKILNCIEQFGSEAVLLLMLLKPVDRQSMIQKIKAFPLLKELNEEQLKALQKLPLPTYTQQRGRNTNLPPLGCLGEYKCTQVVLLARAYKASLNKHNTDFVHALSQNVEELSTTNDAIISDIPILVDLRKLQFPNDSTEKLRFIQKWRVILAMYQDAIASLRLTQKTVDQLSCLEEFYSEQHKVEMFSSLWNEFRIKILNAINQRELKNINKVYLNELLDIFSLILPAEVENFKTSVLTEDASRAEQSMFSESSQNKASSQSISEFQVVTADKLLRLYKDIRDHYIESESMIINQYDFLFSRETFNAAHACLGAAMIKDLREDFTKNEKKYKPLQREFLRFILDNLEDIDLKMDFSQYILKLVRELTPIEKTDRALFLAYYQKSELVGNYFDIIISFVDGFLKQLKASGTKLRSGMSIVSTVDIEAVIARFNEALVSYGTDATKIFQCFEQGSVQYIVSQEDLVLISGYIVDFLKEKKYDQAIYMAKLFNISKFNFGSKEIEFKALFDEIKKTNEAIDDLVKELEAFPYNHFVGLKGTNTQTIFSEKIKSPPADGLNNSKIKRVFENIPLCSSFLSTDVLNKLKEILKIFLQRFSNFCKTDVDNFCFVNHHDISLVYQLYVLLEPASKKNNFSEWLKDLKQSIARETTVQPSVSARFGLSKTGRSSLDTAVYSTRIAIINAYKKLANEIAKHDESSTEWAKNPENISKSISLKFLEENPDISDETFWRSLGDLQAILFEILIKLEKNGHLPNELDNVFQHYKRYIFNVGFVNKYMMNFANKLAQASEADDTRAIPLLNSEFNYLALIVKRLHIQLSSEVSQKLNETYLPLLNTNFHSLADMIGKEMCEIGGSVKSYVSSVKGVTHV